MIRSLTIKTMVSIILYSISIFAAKAQVNEAQLGSWYMYFYNTTFNEGPWGIQGDLQHRNWNIAGDLQQIMLRSGVTYQPQGISIKFTLGYANITTGTFGDESATFGENRIYQEIIFPVKFGNRFYTNHRYRFEQRYVEGQDFRTRYRYNLFLNVPITGTEMKKSAVYLAFYNELFINGQKDIGNGIEVAFFDRNRLYAALGYVIKDGTMVQAGVMNQSSNSVSKNQMQFSLHHTF